jgi:hypothetical protein
MIKLKSFLIRLGTCIRPLRNGAPKYAASAHAGKTTKFGLLGAVFAGAMAACSATWCQAATIVANFDALDTSGGIVSGAAVTSYLAGYGITFSSADGGIPQVQRYFAGNPFPVPVSSPNYFDVLGSNSGFSYTLTFSSSLNSLSFTVPGLGDVSTMAAWSATAYSATNVQLSQVGVSNISFPGSSTQTYILTGPDIASVVFSDNVENFAGNHLALDDLTMSTPLPASLPLFASSLGGLGLLAWRRRRKAAGAVV